MEEKSEVGEIAQSNNDINSLEFKKAISSDDTIKIDKTNEINTIANDRIVDTIEKDKIANINEATGKDTTISTKAIDKTTGLKAKRSWFRFPKPPRLGMRIIKSALAVILALIVSDYFIGALLVDTQNFDSSIAVIVAILTIQDTVRNTVRYAAERVIGTIFGGLVGLGALYFIVLSSNLGSTWQHVIFYAFGAFCTILTIYVCKIVKKPSMAGLSAFICIAVMYGFTYSNPYLNTLGRVIETIIGILIAVCVDRFVCPVKINKNNTNCVDNMSIVKSYPHLNTELCTNVDNSYTNVDNSLNNKENSQENITILCTNCEREHRPLGVDESCPIEQFAEEILSNYHTHNIESVQAIRYIKNEKGELIKEIVTLNKDDDEWQKGLSGLYSDFI